VPAGAGDAVAADGPARPERAEGGGVPGVARAGLQRQLPRPAGQQVPAAGREVPAARRRGGVLLRLRRGPGRRAEFHRRSDALVAPGERRRREEPGHPPGQHHAPPAERRRAARGRRRAGHGAPVGGPGGRRRPHLGPGAGFRPGRRDGREGGQGMIELDRYQDALTIQRVLHSSKTIAVVGLSGNELRASYFVGYYLKRHGYRVIPVNPRETEVLGATSYPRPLDVPDRVELANVCRAPDALPGIAREAVQIGARSLWSQFGVINDEGAPIAEDGGLSVVMDRCIKVEHARYVGRMHWLGFNTKRITSVRGGIQ